MTNHVRARDLLWYAREVLGEMRSARERGVWNGVVRRGQEALEMSLKAVLLLLGVDYPHEHDVAPVLRRALVDRGMGFDPERLAEIERASRELARKRAPALYVEIVCTEAEAAETARAAEQTFRFAVGIVGEPPDGPFRP